MTTATITGTRSQTDYYVEVGGIEYRVQHYVWPCSQWQPCGERWTVFSSQGIHRYSRECDPAKATYKRVLAATLQALAASKSQEKN